MATLLLAGAGWWYFRRSTSLPPMKVVRFTSYAGVEKDPALSPDGKRLAFVWDGERGGNFDVYVRSIEAVGELPLTAEEPLRLTTDPARDISPTWSPDGRFLAFARVSEGNCGVYLVPSTPVPLGTQMRNRLQAGTESGQSPNPFRTVSAVPTDRGSGSFSGVEDISSLETDSGCSGNSVRQHWGKRLPQQS